eukprot:8208648-Pyramimonas_sp.AAC.1
MASTNVSDGERKIPASKSRQAPGAWSDYNTVFTNAKAGMDNVDKEKVKRVVFEMSQGSAHFKNEQRKEVAQMERIERMQAQLALLSPAKIAAHDRAADSQIAMLEATRCAPTPCAFHHDCVRGIALYAYELFCAPARTVVWQVSLTFGNRFAWLCRDLSRTYIHVDMDAFYAAVETLDNPSLATKPMCVGGMSMISTANYVARQYGVRSAMPGSFAAKR